MESVEHVADGPIEEDIRFQMRLWIAERIGWAAMGLFVGAALLGLFSDGPLTRLTAANGTLSVEYDTVVRREGNAELVVAAQPVRDGAAEIALSASFLETHRIMGIQPEPTEHRPEAGGARYRFEAHGGAVRVHFATRPSAIGATTILVTGPGGERVSFGQLTLP